MAFGMGCQLCGPTGSLQSGVFHGFADQAPALLKQNEKASGRLQRTHEVPLKLRPLIRLAKLGTFPSRGRLGGTVSTDTKPLLFMGKERFLFYSLVSASFLRFRALQMSWVMVPMGQ